MSEIISSDLDESMVPPKIGISLHQKTLEVSIISGVAFGVDRGDRI